MRFRWTIKELQTVSDNFMLRSLVAERITSCKNVYTPLRKRLQKLYNKLDAKVNAEERRLFAKIRAEDKAAKRK